MKRKAFLSVVATFVLLSTVPLFGYVLTVSSDNGGGDNPKTSDNGGNPGWPMFRHNPNRTGYTPELGPIWSNTTWIYTTGEYVSSSPAVVDGVVYIGSQDKRIYALDASYGDHIWNYTTGGEVKSSPAVVNRVVYVGSCDNRTYAINATNGNKIWSYTTGGEAWSSPTVFGSVVYVASLDNRTYAINASNGNHIWNYTTGAPITSSPAVVDGVVYIGSKDKKVYALNATTGDIVWSYTTYPAGLVHSSPAVAENGIVYIGCGFFDAGREVYALNATNGNKIWSYTTAGNVISSPAVADGKVYVGSDKNVYAIGPMLLRPNLAITPSDLLASPSGVMVGEPIFINVTVTNIGGATAASSQVTVSYDNYPIATKPVPELTAGDSMTITFTWDTTGVLEGPHEVRAEVSPVTGETVTADNVQVVVASVVIPPAVFVQYPWPMFSHYPNRTGYTPAPGPKTNRTIWIHTTREVADSSPAVVNGVVYIGSWDKNVYALNATTGAHIWNYTTESGIHSSPAVFGGVVYVASLDNRTYALNASNGNHIWNHTTGGQIFSSPAVVDGVVYIGSWDKNVYALNATTETLTREQRLIWKYTTGGGISSSPAVADGVVYVGSWDAMLYALNATTGDSIWNHTTRGGVSSSPAIADSVVYVGSSDMNVYAIGGRVPSVSVTNVTLLPLPYGASVVYPSGNWKVDINVTVWNWGAQSETFQVTSYYDGKLMAGIKWPLITLAPNENVTVTITWKTKGVPHCTYNATTTSYMPYKISARATNTPPGPPTPPTLVIRATGDANGKLPVNVVDLGMVGVAWLNTPYDPRCDFNMDGNINVIDLGLLGVWWLYPD